MKFPHNVPVTNPLLQSILDHLQAEPDGVSEHELMKYLSMQEASPLADYQAGDLALFQAHFMVMNALYQLQQQLVGEGLYLSISPLRIGLEKAETAEGDFLQAVVTDAAESKLRSYYLDWDNLASTTGEEVEALLSGFWQRYFAFDRQTEALACLDLSEAADWEAIQLRYRQLAATHHPDRGGEPSDFVQIRQAYELLQRYHQPGK